MDRRVVHTVRRQPGPGSASGPVRRLNPRSLALMLVLLVVVNGFTLTMRYLWLENLPASNYYEFQVQRWETQLADRPEDPVVWATLGGLYDAMGSERKASRAFAKALELDADNPAALMYVARADRESGEVAEARGKLERAADSLPTGGKYAVLFELGELERAAGRPAAAIRAYEASFADNSTFWNAPRELAFLYRASGQLDLALTAALQAQLFASEDVALSRLVKELRAAGAVSSVRARSESATGDSR